MSLKSRTSPAKRWIWNDAVFAGLTLALVALTYTPLATPFNEPLCALSYSGADSLLGLLGIAHEADPTGHVISGEAFALEVNGLCSGLRALALFFAVMALLRIPRRRKALHLVLGAAILVVVNIVRIAHLYSLGESRSTRFALYHEWLWPIAIVGVILSYRLVMLIAARAGAAAEKARGMDAAHG